jgi:hypothetical protein
MPRRTIAMYGVVNALGWRSASGQTGTVSWHATNEFLTRTLGTNSVRRMPKGLAPDSLLCMVRYHTQLVENGHQGNGRCQVLSFQVEGARASSQALSVRVGGGICENGGPGQTCDQLGVLNWLVLVIDRISIKYLSQWLKSQEVQRHSDVHGVHYCVCYRWTSKLASIDYDRCRQRQWSCRCQE